MYIYIYVYIYMLVLCTNSKRLVTYYILATATRFIITSYIIFHCLPSFSLPLPSHHPFFISPQDFSLSLFLSFSRKDPINTHIYIVNRSSVRRSTAAAVPMAEGFELYHVPQQSRRDKLRVSSHHPPPPPDCSADSFQASAALLPLYDPTLIPSDFVTCAANVHRHTYGLDPVAGVKEEGANLMAFLGGTGGAGHVFADPDIPAQLNPSSIQDINGGSYAYPSPAHCFQSYHPRQEPNGTGQSLSLSLSSNHSTIPNLPLELNLQKYDFGPCKAGFGPIESSKSTVPLGPFTGYASVLKGSRFLRPAQQLLEELCDMSRGMYSDKNGADPGLLDPPSLDNLSGDGIMDDSGDGGEQTGKKSRLLSMLDEVYKRYTQYYQQMQAAVSAFESVAGLSSAAPFANLALKAMSKHFRCLKNAITDQLQFTSKTNLKANSNRDETQRLENLGKGLYVQRPLQGAGFVDPPVWRPQRGLPEHAVTVLRSWLFEHFLHPYPTDTDKLMLAKQTGLSRNQVSNWFINARVRLWKPMVEEIHTLETRQQGQNSSQMTDQSPNSSCHLSTSHPTERKSSYPDNFPSKRTREGPTSAPRANSLDPIKSPYDNLLPNNSNNNNNNNQFHAGMGSAGGNSGVSLTLGLHQNELGLPDSYPINAARRFGLDLQPEEYVGHNRQFGREMVDGQQIMHDFVG